MDGWTRLGVQVSNPVQLATGPTSLILSIVYLQSPIFSRASGCAPLQDPGACACDTNAEIALPSDDFPSRICVAPTVTCRRHFAAGHPQLLSLFRGSRLYPLPHISCQIYPSPRWRPCSYALVRIMGVDALFSGMHVLLCDQALRNDTKSVGRRGKRVAHVCMTPT